MNHRIIMLFGITLLQCDSLATSYFHNRSRQEEKKSNYLNIAGLLAESDDDFFSMKNVFDCTITLINEGWFPDLLNDTYLNFTSVDPTCDDLTALNAFVDIALTSRGEIDAVIGPKCSSGALYTAVLTTKFKIIQVSPSASSNSLEGKHKFPFFSRLVASVDIQASAMVAMLQHFNWTRVSIIATDSEYAKSYVEAFRSNWNNASQLHEIVRSELVTLNQYETVNQESVKLALEHIPVDDPLINSRVILLVAYDEQAFSILKTAYETAFQPDTIWVGTETWIGHTPKTFDTDISKSQGYIGITPFRNRDKNHKKFLKKCKKYQERNGKVPVIKEFPDYVTENLVDSILAVAKAFSNTPLHLRKDSQYVTSELRKLKFHGVSGYVSFRDNGDRLDPRYQIYNMQSMKGNPKWIPIGEITTQENTSPTIQINNAQIVCFAGIGCTKNYPNDRYEPQRPPNWVVIGIIAFFFVGLICICVLGAFHCLSLQGREDQQKINRDLRSVVEETEKFRISREKSIKQLEKSHMSPSTWSNSKEILVEIQSCEQEFKQVEKDLQESMHDVHISKLWRIQNKSLWIYYCLQKDRLSMNKIPLNEQNVWHGTSEVDPAIIYRDKQDGFMMQVSQKGSWG
jgi:ABC-type branched-subunit amino acid transport system substrate-binding protein